MSSGHKIIEALGLMRQTEHCVPVRIWSAVLNKWIEEMEICLLAGLAELDPTDFYRLLPQKME